MHISPGGPVGTHISRAPDGLRWYSARPRTRTTRAGGTKGGAGGEAPRQIHLKYGFSTSKNKVFQFQNETSEVENRLRPLLS